MPGSLRHQQAGLAECRKFRGPLASWDHQSVLEKGGSRHQSSSFTLLVP